MTTYIEEREAGERWCPMTGVRTLATNPVTAATKCLGSECMAWVTSEANEDFGRCGMVRFTTLGSCGKV